VASILLLPGLACDAALWRHQLPALTAAGHEVQVTDVHARFDTLPAMAAALLAEHRGAPVLVGSSMGGMLALEMQRQAPARVPAMALLGTSARPDTPELLRLRSEAITLFAQGRAAEVLRANIPFALHPRAADHAALVADYLAMMERAGAEQLTRQNRAVMARIDSRPGLPAVRCPVLVVCGDADLLTPPEHAQEMAQAIPGARLEIVPTCGHLLNWEQPERVNALLLDWLAGMT
jgi:pimeloyl-ACP methyl ester carboxylesterase